MSNKRKIFNDPVYGFISFPFDILYDIIDHPHFQRLRRITQMGMSHYIYPGAVHTRFHHALGSLHLMTEAISALKSKSIAITDEEAEAVCIAILLHDVGHGPFSHALEGKILDVAHEDISLIVMEMLNTQFDGRLELAITIFKNEYPKKFLFQLVSGQLDMDRMDYLNRDSFYTGVAEGIIGYERIIKMINVVDDCLVVEEKGIYSIEKFLMSRSIMYWQVYLHKTSIAIEKMLVLFFELLKEHWDEIPHEKFSDSLIHIIENTNAFSKSNLGETLIPTYLKLDDIDILSAIKYCQKSNIKLLAKIAADILDRRLFKVILSKTPFESDFIEGIRQKICRSLCIEGYEAERLILQGVESNQAYNTSKNEIQILMKPGNIRGLSEVTDFFSEENLIEKHYLCFPK